jgi:hypothetical protein
MTQDQERIDPITWGAARLELLSLRGSVHASMRLSPDAYALFPDRGVIRGATATVPLLMAAPKPLVCRASVSAGTVVIRRGPPREGTLEFLAYSATTAFVRDREELESFSQSIRKAVGASGIPYERATVLCAARDETLILPVAAVERWERDYATVLGGYALDSIENPLTEDWPAYIEARARGAACVLRVGEIPSAVT